MFARRGLSQRLNVIVISINLIILAIVAVLANMSSVSAFRRQSIERFTSKNSEVVSRLDSTLGTVIDIATSLSESISDVEDLNDSAALRTYVLQHLTAADNQELIFRIGVLRPDTSIGVLLLDNPDDLNDYQWRIYRQERDLPESTFISQSNQIHEPMWIPEVAPYADSLAREAVSFAYPYEHEQGSGLLWVDIAQSDLQETVTAALNAEGLLTDTDHGYALLLDQNNVMLTQHNIPDTLNIAQRLATLLQRSAEANRNADHLYRLDDPFNGEQPGLFSIGRLMNNDWHLISVLPENEVPVLPGNVFLPIGIVGLLGILTLIVAVNHFIAQSVVHPLVDLGRSASEIGEGNLRFIVFHQDKQDEIGNLANAMDRMRSRLEDTYDELQDWSRTLEKRVNERTQQLAIAQQRAEENAAQVRAVYDESLSVVNETQLRPVLDTFIERILNMLDATYCAIWLLTPEKKRIRLVATSDERRREGEGIATVSVDSGIVGQVIMQGEPVRVEDYAKYERRVVLPSDDGRLPFVRGVCAPLMFAGQAVGAAVVGRPASAEPFTVNEERYLTLFANLVSPSVHNAQLLVQLQNAVDEAYRANEVRTRFLASVTHELRTPLNLIINNMDFMRVGAFGDVTPEQTSRLNQTVRSAEHLLYLINDLLDVSKIEAGEMQLFIQKHEVYTMLEDAVDNANALLESYNKSETVSLHVEIDEGLPEIPMDTRRIRQVLNNLLSNGIKFTQAGTVTLKVFAGATGIHFSVHDTGMGIPPEEMDSLFEAFERTTTAKQHNIEGTGLGLPISRYLVQQHGSDLTIVSEVGVGSTFAFTLPYETPKTIPNVRPTDTQQMTALLSSRNT